MTVDQMKDAIAFCDKAMKACTAMTPKDRPNLVRNSCTCATCKPQAKR